MSERSVGTSPVRVRCRSALPFDPRKEADSRMPCVPGPNRSNQGSASLNGHEAGSSARVRMLFMKIPHHQVGARMLLCIAGIFLGSMLSWGCNSKATSPREQESDAPATQNAGKEMICPQCMRRYFGGEFFCVIDQKPLVEANQFKTDAKVCPMCKRTFPGNRRFCTADGTKLVVNDGTIVAKAAETTPGTAHSPEKSATIAKAGDTGKAQTRPSRDDSPSALPSRRPASPSSHPESAGRSATRRPRKVASVSKTKPAASSSWGEGHSSTAGDGLASSSVARAEKPVSKPESQGNSTYVGTSTIRGGSGKSPVGERLPAQTGPSWTAKSTVPAGAGIRDSGASKTTDTSWVDTSVAMAATEPKHAAGQVKERPAPTPIPVKALPEPTPVAIAAIPPRDTDRTAGGDGAGAVVLDIEKDFDRLAEAARQGLLTKQETDALKRVKRDDPAFTKSRLLLAAQNKGRNNQAYGKALIELVSLPENHYNAAYNLELAEYYLMAHKYKESVDAARLAERYVHKLSPSVIHAHRARMYEVAAKAYEGLFNTTEDVRNLDKAVKMWRKYIAVAARKDERDKVKKGEDYIAKLEKVRRRIE